MYKTELNIRSAYKEYSKESSNPVECKEFVSIANEYMKFLFEKVLEGEEVTLPAKMGTLLITGRKRALKFNKDGVPMLPPNWGATKKLWERDPEAKATKKVVYCLNEHTNGVSYKINWSKNRVPIENKIYYNLIMVRENKRAVNKKVTKEKKEYLIKT
jgi:hypothetical protein